MHISFFIIKVVFFINFFCYINQYFEGRGIYVANLFLPAFINLFLQPFTNVMMDTKTEQRNAYFWIVVAVVVIVMAAFYAACIAYGAKFTGEFSFLGFAFKVQCG